jgi:uncharacterized glyoxalase superfamily protein PhnB
MTDAERPFRSLARPVVPVEPDPAFTAALRERLRRALLQQPTTPTSGGRSAMSSLTPYLAVRDARAAMAWYSDALGARVVGDPYVMDDDRIGHAELDVAGAPLYLADEHPELGLVGPDENRVSVTLHLAVSDVDAAVARCEAAGATVERQPTDAPYGRTGVIVDLTLQVPDGARARDFYEAVLGWSMTPGRVADGWEAQGQNPMIGLHGGEHDDLGVVPMYATDDIEVAVAAVRTAGGAAGEIERQSYGLSALCRDDQGLPFWLGQLS